MRSTHSCNGLTHHSFIPRINGYLKIRKLIGDIYYINSLEEESHMSFSLHAETILIFKHRLIVKVGIEETS